MLDLNTPKGKIIDAALKLAAEVGWNGLTLDRIATHAGVSLAEFRKHFSAKPQVLAAFTRAVDDAVLAKVTDPAENARERLFDVLMTRFDLMAPYKAGLKRIADDLRTHPGEGLAQLLITARSQYWMLTAAGVRAEGPRGAVRLPGVIAVYLKTFEVWLQDTDEGLAKTMAALDSRLRQGERFMQQLHDIRSAAERFCSAFMPSRCPPKAPATAAAPAAETPSTDAPAAPAATAPANTAWAPLAPQGDA